MTTSEIVFAKFERAKEKEVAAYQSAVQRIAEHLAKQRAQALNEEKECCYRGAERTMCAVGCLIPDSLYDPQMEGDSVSGILNEWPEILGAIGIDSNLVPTVMDEIQNYHDKLGTYSGYPTYLGRIMEMKGKPDEELEAKIREDLSSIVTKVVNENLEHTL